MDQRKLSRWLTIVAAGCAFCGVILLAFLMPMGITVLTESYPGFHARLWIVLSWLMAVPCFAVLGCVAKIADEIGRDRSFSHANARLLKIIALLAAGDAAALFAITALFALFDRAMPPLLALICAFICFTGVAIAVAAACLSHLVLKAARLQEENDLTI